MRVLPRLCLVVSLAGLLARPGAGQFRPGAAEPLSEAELLLNKSVQQELKLSAGQVSTVRKAAQDVREKYSAESKRLTQQRQSYFARQRQFLKKRDADLHKALAGILKPEQLTRLQQIELQARGLRAFFDPEVQNDLQLTPDQRKAIQALGEEVRRSVAQLRRGNLADPKKVKAARTRFVALLRKKREQFVAQLTPAQQKHWQGLNGKAFAGVDALAGAFFPYPPRGFDPTPGLLLNTDVQQELKISATQRAKVDSLLDQFSDKYQADLEGLRRELRKLMAAAEQLDEQIDEETNKAATAVLKPGQLKRLHQLEVQQLGLRAFTDDLVQKELRLSADQKKEMRKALADLRQQIAQAREEASRDPQQQRELGEQIGRLVRKARERMLKKLSADQQKRWKKMTGAAFPFKPDAPRTEPDKGEGRK